MKKRVGSLLLGLVMAISLILAAVVPAVVTTVDSSADTATAVPVYRLFNIYDGEHLYTLDLNEYEVLGASGRWNQEGVAWYSPSVSSSPVYRIFNRISGEHLYTRDKHEVDVHVGEGYWNYEGICWYSDDNQAVTINRLYNSAETLGAHHYTKDTNEVSVLIAERGWVSEGIAWYALDSSGMLLDPATPEPTPEPTPVAAEEPYWSMECDVTMRGTGSGYYAKILVSNISNNSVMADFGIDCEDSLNAAYGGTTNCGYVMENLMYDVAIPGNSGKNYQHTASTVDPNATHHIKLEWYKSTNRIVGYADGVAVLSDTTTMAANASHDNFHFGVAGSARLDGDSIDCTFSNIVIQCGDSEASYGTDTAWFDGGCYYGLTAQVVNPGAVVSSGRSNTHGYAAYGATIRVFGTADIPGTDSNGNAWDWDSCFARVEPTTGTVGKPIAGQMTIAQT